MWSSTFHSLVAIALLGACTGDPQVVIEVTNTTGGALQVYSCKSGGNEGDGLTVCRPFPVAANQHSVGIYTSQPAMRVIFQLTGDVTYCQQLDLDLASTPVDLAYSPAPTAQPTALESCEPATACGPLVPCSVTAARLP